MAMLDDLLKQAQPGINPELEQMISKLMLAGGASSGQAASGVKGLSPQPQPSNLGIESSTPPAMGAAPQGGVQDNQTYQILVKKGVPPEIAQQAMNNPQLLKDLLAQVYRQAGPTEAPPALASSQPNRMSAPPLGGGGGYG